MEFKSQRTTLVYILSTIFLSMMIHTVSHFCKSILPERGMLLAMEFHTNILFSCAEKKFYINSTIRLLEYDL